MLGSSEKILEFPQDEDFWFVKWLDEFRLPHQGTRSASISVILQKLPFKDFESLNKLKSEDVKFLFSPVRAKNLKEIEEIKEKYIPNVKTPLPRVMVGTLPKLYIGSVYCNQVQIGELPAERLQVSLPTTRNNFGVEISLKEELSKPPQWGAKFPYKILNPFEFSDVAYSMPNSRCLVIEQQNITYIIPKTTIFKTFYAPHTELAKAFCKGPWSETLKEVIFLGQLKSGLQTGIDLNTKQWDIILHTLVEDDYAELLALLYFDPYARSLAESIYSRSLQDRNAKSSSSWYASADIPFKKTNEPFRFTFKGYRLKNGKHTDKKKILVTQIIGSSWPSYIPTIGYERVNSSLDSENPIETDQPNPYKGQPKSKESTLGTVIDGQHDAHVNSTHTKMRSSEFGWLNPPKKIKLKKEFSKKYDRLPYQSPDIKNSRVSTGEHGYQNDSVGVGEISTPSRSPNKRFEQILDAFNTLKTEQFIKNFTVIAPNISKLQTEKGGLSCWSFLDEEYLEISPLPKRNWRYVEYIKNEKRIERIERSALILALEIGNATHYWFEIECRVNDSGFCSPVLLNVKRELFEIIKVILQRIANSKGINLKLDLPSVLSQHGLKGSFYTHHFINLDDESEVIDIKSLKRFLSSLGIVAQIRIKVSLPKVCRFHATRTVLGVPSPVNQLRSAARMCNSTT